MHGGVRRHGAADLAGQVHSLLLRTARDLFLRAARREDHLLYLILFQSLLIFLYKFSIQLKQFPVLNYIFRWMLMCHWQGWQFPVYPQRLIWCNRYRCMLWTGNTGLWFCAQSPTAATSETYDSATSAGCNADPGAVAVLRRRRALHECGHLENTPSTSS